MIKAVPHTLVHLQHCVCHLAASMQQSRCTDLPGPLYTGSINPSQSIRYTPPTRTLADDVRVTKILSVLLICQHTAGIRRLLSQLPSWRCLKTSAWQLRAAGGLPSLLAAVWRSAAGAPPADISCPCCRRARSRRAPSTWPTIAHATVQAIAHFGITTACTTASTCLFNGQSYKLLRRHVARHTRHAAPRPGHQQGLRHTATQDANADLAQHCDEGDCGVHRQEPRGAEFAHVDACSARRCIGNT